jgi:hypothetical protein
MKRLTIKTYNFGFSDKNETTTIYDCAAIDGSSHASIYNEVLEGIHKYNDTIATKIELKVSDEFIDLVKIDTEGNESKIFQWALNAIKSRTVKCFQFE